MAISTSRPRRTGHPPISYRDESTDDERTTAPPTTRPSHRLRRKDQRSRSPGEESDTDEEFEATNVKRRQTRAGSSNTWQTTRSSRRAKNVKNYNEDLDGEYGEVEPQIIHNAAPARKPAPDQRKRPRPTQAVLKKGPFHSFKRQKTNHHNSGKVVDTSTAAYPVTSPGKIPPWQTLPYQILLSILQYASYPFYRDASHETGSITWLIGASTLSKSFHDASVATLLYSPPLFPSYRAHSLQQILNARQERLSTSYRNKVKRLDVEVRSLLIKKSGINLISLIKRTPLLSALHLYHNYDRVGAVGWAQPSASTGRSWSYPPVLFEALDENDIRLKEWSWNGRFPDTKSVLDQMNNMHGRECLKGLTSLSILNLAAPEKIKDEEKGTSEDALTAALKALPDLQEVKLQNCTIVNERILGSLPSRLRHLSITNCRNFNSAHLRLYLINHGYELEELILTGNQALDLGFAGFLETLCPNLQLFKMDLTYSDPTAFHDIDPHYEAVFPDGIMPTWPRTLQTIDIENLRNLDAQDAESFLGSLITVASELKDLRKISIRILLQEDGWRERAQLRQTWMPKLEEVFLRKTAPPAPFIFPALLLPSFPATAISFRPSTSHSNSSTSFTTGDSTAVTPNKRKSARIAKRELDDLANQAFGKAKFAKKNKAAAAGSEDDDDDDDDDLDTSVLRQGMCSEVSLHIDGQRPADEQFKEADFLDDERSGDEDWNGKDVEAPSRYAW